MNSYADAHNEHERRDSRFFTGDNSELQKIKSKESLQKFVRHNRKKKAYSRLSYILILLVLSTLFLIICLAVFFKIKDVEVLGSTRYSTEELLDYCGIETGQSLYEVSSSDLAGLSDRFSYIRSARLTRKLPHTLIITIVEDEPSYYCELYGEYFVMSQELRVLERSNDEEKLKENGLIMLKLPEIDSAIIGHRLTFTSDSDDKYVTAYLNALDSSMLYKRVTAFDLRDKFDLKLICDSIYLVELAGGDDLPTKLTATAGVLATEEAFPEGVAAQIDMANPAMPSAIVNPSINISFDP
ncbi:MAG: FtsQ-type POTRA domain-containing protein [Clostridiales bacterium]|nr:FtsQ-type POTRA domain-containing protein [Clostridiales bacterium]